MSLTSIERSYPAFQSTLPHRERLGQKPLFGHHSGFQSTLPHRERRKTVIIRKSTLSFQSTLPHRERRGINGGCKGIADFNPRSRTGSDIRRIGHNIGGEGISIHAPAQGATGAGGSRRHRRRFQSTLPHRERRFLFIVAWIFWPISIHAPAQGATSFAKISG